MDWTLFWSAVSAIATVVAAIAAVVGTIAIFSAMSQLRFQAWLEAQEIWTADDFTKARGRVFARLDTGNTEWTEEEKAEALDVCRKMDKFAGLIPYLPKRTALRIWGVPFANAWLILAPVVENERKKAWPEKWDNFKQLGESALASHPEVRKKKEVSIEKVGG